MILLVAFLADSVTANNEFETNGNTLGSCRSSSDFDHHCHESSDWSLEGWRILIMNTSSAMMTAELFSKPVPQLAGALALAITSEHTRKCVGFHRGEPQRQWWQCLLPDDSSKQCFLYMNRNTGSYVYNRLLLFVIFEKERH